MNGGLYRVSSSPGYRLPGEESPTKEVNHKKTSVSSQAKTLIAHGVSSLKEKASNASIQQIGTAVFTCAALAVAGVGIYRVATAIPALFRPIYTDQLHKDSLDTLRGVNNGESFVQDNQKLIDRYFAEQSSYRRWPQSGKDYIQECLSTNTPLAASATEYFVKKGLENQDNNLLKAIRKTCAATKTMTPGCLKAHTLLSDKLSDTIKSCRKSHNAFCQQAKNDQLAQSIQNTQTDKAQLAEIIQKNDEGMFSTFIESDLFASIVPDDRILQDIKDAKNSEFVQSLIHSKKHELIKSIQGHERKIVQLCLDKKGKLPGCEEGMDFLQKQLASPIAAPTAEEKKAKLSTASSIKKGCKNSNTALCATAKKTVLDLTLDPTATSQNWLPITKLLAEKDTSPEFANFVESSCQTFLKENPILNTNHLWNIYWDLKYRNVFDQSPPSVVKIAISLANALSRFPSSASYEEMTKLLKDWRDKCEKGNSDDDDYYRYYSSSNDGKRVAEILSNTISQLEKNRVRP